MEKLGGLQYTGRKESDTTERLHFTSKIIISGPITLWQTEGEKVEAVTDFIFLGSKITYCRVISTMKLKDACSLEGKL